MKLLSKVLLIRLKIILSIIFLTLPPSSVTPAMVRAKAIGSPIQLWLHTIQAPTNVHEKDWPRIRESPADNYQEIAKLVASDAQAGVGFGVSVAMSGNTLVVGAYPGDPLPLGAGAVYVFERDLGGLGNWVEAAKLTASDPQMNDLFGSSVAISGDTIVVGAYREDGGPGDPLPDAGAAYVFERDLGGPRNWGEAAKLTASDAQQADSFGSSVTIGGDTIVIGAWGEDGGPGNPLDGAGAAYIFGRDLGGSGNWGEAAKLTPNDAEARDSFGTAVAINGSTLIIGAVGVEGIPGMYTGAVYVFERDLGGAGNWGQSDKLFASDAQDDNFGISVAIDGNTLVVGAWLADGSPGIDAGAAYVFERDLGGLGNWGEAVKLMASDAQSSDLFGNAVGISGDRVVVGAYKEDGGPGDPIPLAGVAYVFERNLGGPESWLEAAKLTSSDTQATDFFGKSLAISGNTIVVGAYSEDGGPGDPLPAAGAAYLFQSMNQVFIPFISRE